VEKYTINNYFYTLENSDLDRLNSLPNQRLSQTYFYTKSDYDSSLLEFKKTLFTTAKNRKFIAIDLSEGADRLGSDFQLFSTSIHFTHEGADYLAKEMVDDIVSIMRR
jgi:hypothetical protein